MDSSTFQHGRNIPFNSRTFHQQKKHRSRKSSKNEHFLFAPLTLHLYFPKEIQFDFEGKRTKFNVRQTERDVWWNSIQFSFKLRSLYSKRYECNFKLENIFHMKYKMITCILKSKTGATPKHCYFMVPYGAKFVSGIEKKELILRL